VCLSHPTKKSFRYKLWPEYKANRKGREKPVLLSAAFAVLTENFSCISFPELEADDLLGLFATSSEVPDPVIVSVDKDMLCIPGKHWNPNKDFDTRIVTEDEAYRSFCLQWLMGDSSDGYPGIPGCGPKKAEKILESHVDPTTAVFAAYQQAGLDFKYCVTMGRLAKILTAPYFSRRTNKRILFRPSKPLWNRVAETMSSGRSQ
jgi:DNA polymerase-1